MTTSLYPALFRTVVRIEAQVRDERVRIAGVRFALDTGAVPATVGDLVGAGYIEGPLLDTRSGESIEAEPVSLAPAAVRIDATAWWRVDPDDAGGGW